MKEQHLGFIYKTINTLNGKIYIGQKTHRRKKSENPVPSYLGSGSKIKLAIKKYGVDNFKREILCWCYTKKGMDDCEKFFIKQFNSQNSDVGYNMISGGQIHMPKELVGLYGKNNPNYGNKWSDEQKQKMSKMVISRNYGGQNNPNYNNKWSDEQRRKASETKKRLGKEKGSKNPKAISIICIQTQKIYGCIKDLSDELHLSYSMVSGRIRKNKPINGNMYEKINIKK